LEKKLLLKIKKPIALLIIVIKTKLAKDAYEEISGLVIFDATHCNIVAYVCHFGRNGHLY
jgi:hypothetical protein